MDIDAEVAAVVHDTLQNQANMMFANSSDLLIKD